MNAPDNKLAKLLEQYKSSVNDSSFATIKSKEKYFTRFLFLDMLVGQISYSDIIEICGEASSLKTTLAIELAACSRGKCVYFNIDNKLTDKFKDVIDISIGNITSIEQLTESIREIPNSFVGTRAVFIIDGFATLRSKAEIEQNKELIEDRYANIRKLLEACKYIGSVGEFSIIIVNQARSVPPGIIRSYCSTLLSEFDVIRLKVEAEYDWQVVLLSKRQPFIPSIKMVAIDREPLSDPAEVFLTSVLATLQMNDIPPSEFFPSLPEDCKKDHKLAKQYIKRENKIDEFKLAVEKYVYESRTI